MLITVLFAHAFAAATPVVASVPIVREVNDPAAGLLVDIVVSGLECSSGVVVAPSSGDGGIEVRELHDGKVQNDDLHVTDTGVQAQLVGGEKVIVYRDAKGISVVGAS